MSAAIDFGANLTREGEKAQCGSWERAHMGYSPGWELSSVETARDIIAQSSDLAIATAAIKVALGRECHPSTLRRAFKKHGLNPPAAYLRRGPTAEAPANDARAFPAGDVRVQPIEALVERYGSAAETRYVRSLERKVGNTEYLGERLYQSLVSAFQRSPIQLTPSNLKPRHVAGRRMITAMVSDVHFGLNVDPREVPGGGYNWQIAARRMARLATEIADWKAHYRDETDLQIIFNGDLIAGRIHLDDAGLRPLTEQIHGATWILVAFIDYLKRHFSRIGVLCTPGNHCRVHEERQVANRWDSHAHAIYLAIANAFRTEKERIKFDIPLTGDGVVDFPGGESLGFYTHGDVRPTVANVGKSLNIKPMVAQLNRINASGEFRKPIKVLGVGHWHLPFTMDSGNGAIIVNGSAIGPDTFARNGCGVMGREGQPMQVMFESVPGYEFGDCRFVRLREADNDAAYDKIITAPSLDVWAA